jgi:hypothetical protein
MSPFCSWSRTRSHWSPRSSSARTEAWRSWRSPLPGADFRSACLGRHCPGPTRPCRPRGGRTVRAPGDRTCVGFPESTAARFGATGPKRLQPGLGADETGLERGRVKGGPRRRPRPWPRARAHLRRSGLEDPRIVETIVLGHPLESLGLDSQDLRGLRNVPPCFVKYPKNIGLLHFLEGRGECRPGRGSASLVKRSQGDVRFLQPGPPHRTKERVQDVFQFPDVARPMVFASFRPPPGRVPGLACPSASRCAAAGLARGPAGPWPGRAARECGSG